MLIFLLSFLFPFLPSFLYFFLSFFLSKRLETWRRNFLARFKKVWTRVSSFAAPLFPELEKASPSKFRGSCEEVHGQICENSRAESRIIWRDVARVSLPFLSFSLLPFFSRNRRTIRKNFAIFSNPSVYLPQFIPWNRNDSKKFHFSHNIFEFVYLFITIYTSKSFAGIIRKNDLLSSQYFRIRLFIYHDLYLEIIRWNNSKKRLTFDSSQYFRIRPFIYHDLYLEIERFEETIHFRVVTTFRPFSNPSVYLSQFITIYLDLSRFISYYFYLYLYISKSQRNDSKKQLNFDSSQNFRSFTTDYIRIFNHAILIPNLR